MKSQATKLIMSTGSRSKAEHMKNVASVFGEVRLEEVEGKPGRAIYRVYVEPDVCISDRIRNRESL